MDKLWLFFLLQSLYVLSVLSQKTYLDSPGNLGKYRLFRNWITQSIGAYLNGFIILFFFLFFIKRRTRKSKLMSWRKKKKQIFVKIK